MNKVLLIGNIGKDIQIKKVGEKNTSLAEFTIATSEKYNNETIVTWHNIKAWGRQAEIIERYFSKGSKIFIEGKITNETWIKSDGNKGYKTIIVLTEFEFIDKKKNNNNNNEDDLPF